MDKKNKKKESKRHKFQTSGDSYDFVSTTNQSTVGGSDNQLKKDFDKLTMDYETRGLQIKDLQDKLEKNQRLLQNLTDISSKGCDNATIGDIHAGVLKQRDELHGIYDKVKKHVAAMKAMKEAVKKGECARCAAAAAAAAASREANEDELAMADSVQFTRPIECVDDRELVSGGNEDNNKRQITKIILLNDGQTIPLDFNIVDTGFESMGSDEDQPLAVGDTLASTADSSQRRHDSRSQRSQLADVGDDDTTMTPGNAYAFRTDGERDSAAAAAAGQTSSLFVCPLCNRSDFFSVEELTVHVNSHLT